MCQYVNYLEIPITLGAKFHRPGSVKYLSFCLVFYLIYLKK